MTDLIDKARVIQGKICSQAGGFDISLWEITKVKDLVKKLDIYLNGGVEEKEKAADYLWETFWISAEDFELEILKKLFDLVTEFLALGVDTADLDEITMTVNLNN